MLTYRVSPSAAAIRNATETKTANTTETANAADTGAAYRRSFAYFSGVNDAAFFVTETAGPNLRAAFPGWGRRRLVAPALIQDSLISEHSPPIFGRS